MAKTDNPQSDQPEVIDRRSLLTAAAAIAAVSTIPKVTAAEGVPSSVKPLATPPAVLAPKVCAATARRLLEIHRRNELRRASQLPPLSIPKELRRAKRQEELEAFRRFEVAHGPVVWAQVLETWRRAGGNPNLRPNWMEGVRCQNEVRAILRAQWEESLAIPASQPRPANEPLLLQPRPEPQTRFGPNL
jgi:hypothetical protein